MTLTLNEHSGKYQIRSYQAGIIQINDKTFTQSIILTPQTLITDWPPQTLIELTTTHLTIFSTLRPSILLIGTGSTLQFPRMSLYGELINAGIGVEIMTTSAACRTYNALASENRHVAAALIIK